MFDVAYDTSFEQIEQLRKKMLQFVGENGRDYQPSFDIVVSGKPPSCFFSPIRVLAEALRRRPDIPEQTKMTLSAGIQYKSNWQQGAIKGTQKVYPCL